MSGAPSSKKTSRFCIALLQALLLQLGVFGSNGIDIDGYARAASAPSTGA
jgi:hypothetical protein